MRTRLFCFTLLLLQLTGCASVTMVSSWRDELAPRKTYKDVLVVGISDKSQMRQVFEEVMSSELRKRGMSATPSYTLTGGQQLSRETVEQAALAARVEAVLTTRLIDMRKKTIKDGGFVMEDRGHSEAALYGAEGGSVEVFGVSGTGVVSYASFNMKSVEITTSRTAVIESRLFDTATRKPVWSGISNAVDPAGLITASEKFADVVGSSLHKEGLFP